MNDDYTYTKRRDEAAYKYQDERWASGAFADQEEPFKAGSDWYRGEFMNEMWGKIPIKTVSKEELAERFPDRSLEGKLKIAIDHFEMIEVTWVNAADKTHLITSFEAVKNIAKEALEKINQEGALK